MDVSRLPKGIDTLHELLKVLEEKDIRSIDTGRIYGQSEELLGKVHSSERFKIDTKHPGGFYPKPSTKESIIVTGELSLRLLQTNKVDVYYMHAPERRSSIEDVLAGVNALYEAGKFNRFGLSNYLASEVDEVVRICREKGYVVPTVYQGAYSAVARHAEKLLLPTLRKHNMSFYAFSPIAGGFLTKDVETILRGEGRWDPSTTIGALLHALYSKPQMLEGLTQWNQLAVDTGIPKGELAYRWVAHNSALKGELGDGMVVGTRDPGQLTQTVEWIGNGPLSPEIVARIERVWKTVEEVAPAKYFNDSIAEVWMLSLVSRLPEHF